MMQRSIAMLLATSAAFLTFSQVNAQSDYGGGWAVPSLDTTAEIANRAALNSVLNDIAKKEKRNKRPNGDELASDADLLRSFSYDPVPNSSVQTRFISRIAEKDKEAAVAIERAFRGKDINKIYAGIIAPFGLKSRNAADAMTAYTVLGWIISNKGRDPSRQAVLAAREQIGRQMSLANTVSAENLQKFDEELMIQFVIMHSGWLDVMANGDTTARQQHSDAVAELFAQQYGMQLRSLSLTDDGFQ